MRKFALSMLFFSLLAGTMSAATVAVYDFTGKMIYTGTIDNEAPMTVNALVGGVYIAKVGSVTVKFVVK